MDLEKSLILDVEKFGSDSAYIGKKTTSEIPDQDVERMFRDDSL